MAIDSYDDIPDDDPTDELPVLSEAAIRELDARASDPAPEESPSEPRATPEGLLRHPGPAAGTAAAKPHRRSREALAERLGAHAKLAALRARTPNRSRTEPDEVAVLKHRVSEQEGAEHRLRTALRDRDARIARLLAQLQALSSRGAEPQASAPAKAPSRIDTEIQGYREEIAALSDYIAHRSARWTEAEEKLAGCEAEIAELGVELERRAAKIRDAEEQSQRESARADRLQTKLTEATSALRRAQDRMENDHGAPSDPPAPMDTTALAPSLPANDAGPQDGPSGSRPVVPALVCLTSDFPRRYPLDQTTMTIGRDRHCQICTPTPFVSREHARLRIEAGNVVIEDLGSRNGVFVNSVRIERQRLSGGDLVTVGETQFRFSAE